VLLVKIKFDFRVQLTANARSLETVPPHEKSGKSCKPGTLSLFGTGNYTTNCPRDQENTFFRHNKDLLLEVFCQLLTFNTQHSHVIQ